MEMLKDELKKRPVVYVTRDIERALAGLGYEGYSIVTNETALSRKYASKFPQSVTLIPSRGGLLDTHELMDEKEFGAHLASLSDPSLLVFKNTSLIEKKADALGVRLLNPFAALSKKIEEKISQTKWLGELASFYPPYKTAALKEIVFEKPSIVQFNHAHTGEGTIFVKSAGELQKLAEQFPERSVKMSEYKEGPILTLNVAVGEKLIMGNPSYQITGLSPFTDLPFATVGNDYGFGKSILKGAGEKASREFMSMAERIGEKMKAERWRGIFGIDAVYSENRFWLIEVNARQTASVTFESLLQKKKRAAEKTPRLTAFEAHLMSLLEIAIYADLVKIEEGSKIVQRITKKTAAIPAALREKLAEAGFDVLVYENTEMNAELVRIQSEKGIVGSHGALNGEGEKIIRILERS